MFQKIDCIQLHVDDLNEAINFYQGKLGHQLVWRTATAAGFRFPESDGELVVQTEHQGLEVDLLVSSADDAANDFVKAGGKLIVPPFDIQIGRCAVVKDPWDNELVLLDMSKGRFITDRNGNIIGNETPPPTT
jgi:lactoylglutathione lyase